MNEVYILSAVRTPIGSFGGSLSALSAPELGTFAIKAAIDNAKIDVKDIDEVLMGNVLQANAGQAPARQSSINAGIPDTVPCTTINKVCASGMKSIMLGTQSILLNDNSLVVAGGMENMSAVPYYSDSARFGSKFGHKTLIDGLIKDGLTDVYNDYHMGMAAELCADECNISRDEQDEYAIESYNRSSNAWSNGEFNNEVTPVTIETRKGQIEIAKDEEFEKVNFDKIPGLRPAFKKEGTVTAANASTLNDGAASLILASAEFVEKNDLKPIAKVVSYADAAQEPERFTTAPAKAIPIALEKAGLTTDKIDLFEINEAFSVVSLANIEKLGLDSSKVNVNGGAVSLGHPLGCSGARIIVTLIHALRNRNLKTGAAGICNGGGGASAMMIEALY